MDWKVNIDDVPVERQEWSWEDGRYVRDRRHISVALGNTESHPHPFDVELTRLPPGARPCPVHEHSRRWEFFIVVSGRGEITRNEETHEATEGDCFVQPPGTRHRIRNLSDSEDLVYYVIANEVPDDVCTKHRP